MPAAISSLPPRPAPTHERELVEPVDACLPDGRLHRAAVGWSRRPLHRCALTGSPGRKKRWDYWCVTSETHVLSLTVADLDYLGLVTATFFDLRGGPSWQRGGLRPGGLRRPGPGRLPLQPDTVGGGDVAVDCLGLHVAFLEEDGGTRLQVRAGRGRRAFEADVLVALPPGHETLNVLVPWSDTRFQFTSKHNTRPATGTVRLGGHEVRFGPDNDSFGCLDWGRGLWPYRTTWNWGAASGTRGGRTIGLQLGARWTDGTGVTENGICVDGRLSKLGGDVAFRYDRWDFRRPWRVESRDDDRVALDFTPARELPLRVPLGIVGAEAHVCFGHYDGTVVTDDGERVAVDGLVGWAEEMRARW